MSHQTYKSDHSQLGWTNLKFHLKIDYPHNCSLKISTTMYKKEKKEKKQKEKEVPEQSYQARCCVHLNYASLRCVHKAWVASAAPPSLSRLESVTRKRSKLSRACHMWRHASQNDVSKRAPEKTKQIKLVAS